MAELFQSGFKAFQRTECALVRISNDVLFLTDSGKFVVLVLIDLSAAFDIVDHGIFISRLEHCVCIKGVTLSWFWSYLNNRRLCVKVDNLVSTTSSDPHEIPLGPLDFCLPSLGCVFTKHGVLFHVYADCQLYTEQHNPMTH